MRVKNNNDSQSIFELAIQCILHDISKNPSHFKQMHSEALFRYTHTIQSAIQDKLNLQCSFRRTLNPQSVEQLLTHAMQGCCIAMRHGEQKSDGVTELDAEMTKIVQMRAQHNVNDPVTARSAIEFIATMIIFKYFQEKLDIQFAIDSSRNQRALEPAQALARLLGIKCKINSTFNCVNYPEPTTSPDNKLKLFLEKGTLPWKKDLVDHVCGVGTFNSICQGVAQKFSTQNLQPRQIRLMFTHTQQTNAICETHQQPITRFNYYGFVGVNRLSCVFLCDQGFYHATQMSVRCNQGTFFKPDGDHVQQSLEPEMLRAKL